MRQTIAKRIRREVYGDYISTGNARKYHRDKDTGAIQAEPMRKRYKQLKKEHNALR